MTAKSRLVEVKGISKGSGFLIADGLILTAWHVLRPAPSIAPAATVRVWVEGDVRLGDLLQDAGQPATIVWPLQEDLGDDLDFALLTFETSTARQHRPVEWASLPEWGKVDVTTAGYPDIAIDRKRKRREPKGISGWIHAADDLRSGEEGRGTLTMKMLDEDAPAAHPADAWPGMSGAAVFSGDVLIGIVCIAGKEGDRHQLRVLPVDRLFARSDVAEALARSGHNVPPSVNLGGSATAHAPSWNWPRPWDFSGYINDKRSGFIGRNWLFDEVRKWYGGGDGENALLICADFGVGKSAFMAELSADARGMQIAAYHFCHRDTIETLNPATFVRSVAAQLAASLPAYRSAVAADPDARRWIDDAQVDPASAFERAVIAPLHAISSPNLPWVMLVDALDEALDFKTSLGSGYPTTIVRLLAPRAGRLPGWLRILATSRRRLDVQQPVHNAFRWTTLDAEDERNLCDIHSYVVGRCSKPKLASLLLESGKTANDVAEVLSDASQSGGKFLYAARVLNDVESGALPLSQLNDLPPGMDAFYLDTFERRFPVDLHYSAASALLGVLCAQREPMSLANLAAITTTKEAHVRDILERLEDFLQVRTKRYAFDHPSLGQWLCEENEKGFRRAGRFSIMREDAERLIADWARRELAADRVHESEYLARHLGAYLGALDRRDSYERLLFDLRWLQSRLRAAGVNALLLDWAELDKTPALNTLARGLRHSAHVFGHDDSDWRGTDLLPSQILARLQSQSEPEVRNLCLQAGEELNRNAGWPPLTDSLRSSQALLRTLEGHTGPVLTLAALADGRLASGSWDNTIKLWNPATGACEATLEGHTNAVSVLIVLEDGRLASGSRDNTIKLWDMSSGMCAATLEGHTNAVCSLVVLADGRLASGSEDCLIKFWDTASGMCEATIAEHRTGVSALALLVDGRLASGSSVGTITLWNTASRVCEASLGGHTDGVAGLATLADGRLASGSWDGTIKLWDTVSGACDATFEGGARWVFAVAAVAVGRLASGASDKTIRLWNLARGACETTFDGHTGSVSSLATMTDGRLASGSRDNTIRLWDSASGACETPLEGHNGSVSAVAVLVDGRFASGSWDSTVKLWNPANGVCESTFDGHTMQVSAIAVLADGRLALGSRVGTIELWNTVTGLSEATLAGHTRSVSALAALADGRLASASEDHTIKVWNLASGVCEAQLAGHRRSVYALVSLADGRLASGSGDRTIRLWNISSGLCETTLEGHTNAVSTLVPLAGGRLASGSGDSTIKLWNQASGECEATLLGHTQRVSTLVVLDGARLVSGSSDKTIRLWHRRDEGWTGDVRFVADAGIWGLAFSARAGVVAAGDVGGRVHFLKLECHARNKQKPVTT